MLQDNPRHHLAAFAEQDVVGTAGRRAVHDFNPDILFEQAGVMFQCGKPQRLSSAYQDQFRLQCKQCLHMMRSQLVDMGRLPVVDQVFQRDDETAGFGKAVDDDDTQIIAADREALLDCVFAEFLCFIIRQPGYAVECAA